jgi:hypothetical protein
LFINISVDKGCSATVLQSRTASESDVAAGDFTCNDEECFGTLSPVQNGLASDMRAPRAPVRVGPLAHVPVAIPEAPAAGHMRRAGLAGERILLITLMISGGAGTSGNETQEGAIKRSR